MNNSFKFGFVSQFFIIWLQTNYEQKSINNYNIVSYMYEYVFFYMYLALAVDCEVIISVVVNHRLWIVLLLIYLCRLIIDDRSPIARNNRLYSVCFFIMLILIQTH